jgi:hypothetical protein
MYQCQNHNEPISFSPLLTMSLGVLMVASLGVMVALSPFLILFEFVKK